MTMRALPYLIAALLGVAAALLVSCGGDRSALIPQSSAEDLKAALADVEQAVASGDCAETGRALTRARGALVNLPPSVDDRLVARLQRGIENLESIAPQECQQAATQTQTETVETPTQETTATTETMTEETTTTPTQETTAPPTTAPTEPPPETEPPPGGGAGGDQGAG
jgi:hypothetical protein